MQEKKEYFKSLQKLIDDFNIKGIKEVQTIALVYQVAFKLVEQSRQLVPPIFYSFTDLDIKKETVNKVFEEVNNCSIKLLSAIQAGEPFDDLVSEFIEENNSTNKNLGQYFTPKDIASIQAEITLSTVTIDKFPEDGYFWIGDDTGCGSGSLILAWLAQVKKSVQGFEDIHYQSIAVQMNDIDVNLSKIAYFQVVLSALLHKKPIGIVVVDGKNIIAEYLQIKNRNLFIANMQKLDKQYKNKQ